MYDLLNANDALDDSIIILWTKVLIIQFWTTSFYICLQKNENRQHWVQHVVFEYTSLTTRRVSVKNIFHFLSPHLNHTCDFHGMIYRTKVFFAPFARIKSYTAYINFHDETVRSYPFGIKGVWSTLPVWVFFCVYLLVFSLLRRFIVLLVLRRSPLLPLRSKTRLCFVYFRTISIFVSYTIHTTMTVHVIVKWTDRNTFCWRVTRPSRKCVFLFYSIMFPIHTLSYRQRDVFTDHRNRGNRFSYSRDIAAWTPRPIWCHLGKTSRIEGLRSDDLLDKFIFIPNTNAICVKTIVIT